MAGRPRIFDEETALEKAGALFWKRGYAATGMEELLDEMGLQKGSFYHHFGSKKELYIEAFNFQEDSLFSNFKNELKHSKAPMQVIKSAFLSLSDSTIDGHKRGCFAGNTIAELSGIDEALVETAKKQLSVLEGIFFRQIKLSQQTGELKTKTDAKLLARYLLNLWNGINITRRMYPSKQILRELIQFQLELIQ